jgi:xanthine dehydrogenase accessory factor
MLQAVADTIRKKDRFALVTVVGASKRLDHLRGQKMAVDPSGVHGRIADSQFTDRIDKLAEGALAQQGACLYEIGAEEDRLSVLVESFHPIERLLVLGGGHIALPLATIASLLQYEVTVIDDRLEFANRKRFPDVHEVVCDDFVQALQKQRIDAGTSIVIVTRGHGNDLECLEYVLQHETGYVGMIGSRRRVNLSREYLAGAGYSKSRIDQVYMPIGLSIGAQMPEEIAVCIAAQLIEARQGLGRCPAPLTSTREQWDLLARILEHVDREKPLVSATVVRTSGSTPRKAGAKMLVAPDWCCLGTIGGGCGEAAVRSEAMMLFETGGCKLFSLTMDADVAAEEGMACGGNMDVFLERLV